MKSKKHPISLEERQINGIDVKHRRYLIWLVWEIFHNVCNKREGNDSLLLGKIVNTCQSLFIIRFSRGEISRRRYLIYFVISLLTEPYEYRSLDEYNGRISHIESKLEQIYKLKEKEIIKEKENIKLENTQELDTPSDTQNKKQITTNDNITIDSYDILLIGGQ